MTRQANASTLAAYLVHRSNFPHVRMSDVRAVATKRFALDADALTSPARHRPVAWRRQDAMLIVRRLTTQSFPAIGRHFGGRDHTTVLHAIRAASNRIGASRRAEIAFDHFERATLDHVARRAAAALLTHGLGHRPALVKAEVSPCAS